MAILSVSVSNELKQEMEKLDDINWSAVARKAFEERVKQILIVEKIISKSKLTEKDAKLIADKIDKAVSKRFLQMKK
ncbi:MAG: hypothetical protein V1740_06120 [Candidatus Woesearchaeota archaeon]